MDIVHLQNGRLTENVFKRISANSKPNSNLNPKAQKCFRETEMTSFFGQVSSSDTHLNNCTDIFSHS